MDNACSVYIINNNENSVQEEDNRSFLLSDVMALKTYYSKYNLNLLLEDNYSIYLSYYFI